MDNRKALTIPTAVMKPLRRGRERTTSKKPKRRRPRALVISPICGVSDVGAIMNRPRVDYLKRGDHCDSSRLEVGMFWPVMRVAVNLLLNHLTDEQRKRGLRAY